MQQICCCTIDVCMCMYVSSQRDVKALLDLVASKQKDLAEYEKRVMDLRLSSGAANPNPNPNPAYWGGNSNPLISSFANLSIDPSASLLPPQPVYNSTGVFMTHGGHPNLVSSPREREDRYFDHLHHPAEYNPQQPEYIPAHSTAASSSGGGSSHHGRHNDHVHDTHHHGSTSNGDASMSWMDSFRQNLQVSYSRASNSHSLGHGSGLPEELRAAQRSLKLARSQLQKKPLSSSLSASSSSSSSSSSSLLLVSSLAEKENEYSLYSSNSFR